MIPKLLPDLANKSVKCLNRYYSVYPTNHIFKDMKLIILLFVSVNDEESDLMDKLKELHTTARDENIRLEILYVPTDREECQVRKCFAKQGSWYMLHNPTDLLCLFTTIYGVTSTPRLVVIQKDGALVSDDGAADIRQYGTDAIIAWS